VVLPTTGADADQRRRRLRNKSTMNGVFRNRTEAGQLLAPELRGFAGQEDVIVLALPRGGVVVGFEIARNLSVPLDVLVVRKLGVPGQEELAMGAIASGDIEFRDSTIIAALNVRPADVVNVIHRERAELERRERAFRGNRPEPILEGATVILVDDGIATGSTMRAAVHAVKSKRPRAIIVAAPVASTEAVDVLRKEATAIVTLVTADRPFAIGEYYQDFRQVEDGEVRTLLAKARSNDGKPKIPAK
jgi:putative phosphoribosyl transferase